MQSLRFFPFTHHPYISFTFWLFVAYVAYKTRWTSEKINDAIMKQCILLALIYTAVIFLMVVFLPEYHMIKFIPILIKHLAYFIVPLPFVNLATIVYLEKRENTEEAKTSVCSSKPIKCKKTKR